MVNLNLVETQISMFMFYDFLIWFVDNFTDIDKLMIKITGFSILNLVIFISIEF